MTYANLLAERISSQKAAVFGAGELGSFWYEELKDKCNLICFIDNAPRKQMEGFLNLPVYSVEKFDEIKSGITVLISVADANLINKFINQLEDYCGLKYNENIIVMRPFLDKLPDEVYLKGLYKIKFGKELNLENPKTFNEKIQWLKLYNRKPEYTQMADKYEVRKYIADCFGEEYLIPLLGVWDNFDDIDFDKLPNQFVLKCNHDCGSAVICKDKIIFDIQAAKIKLSNALNQNWFYTSREYAYRDIEPRIIAEEYIGEDIIDYKLMCFNGKVRCSFTCTERNSGNGLKVTFFNNDWIKLPFTRSYPYDVNDIKKPVNFKKMIDLAEKIAADIPFLRVDFYEVNKKLYIGELTFYPGAGFEKFDPEKYDEILGSWITLPEIKKER